MPDVRGGSDPPCTQPSWWDHVRGIQTISPPWHKMSPWIVTIESTSQGRIEVRRGQVSCSWSESITQTQAVVTFPLYRETEGRGDTTRGYNEKGQEIWVLVATVHGSQVLGRDWGPSSEKQPEPLGFMSSGSFPYNRGSRCYAPSPASFMPQTGREGAQYSFHYPRDCPCCYL